MQLTDSFAWAGPEDGVGAGASDHSLEITRV